MKTLDDLLAQLRENLPENRIPPVDTWHPERQGRIDIRIDAQGVWFHDGRQIKREGLVRVFSTVLRKDPDGYVLVTPAERLLIEVEDVPFVGIDVDVAGSGRETDVVVTTNVGDAVTLDAEHALQMRDGVPYVDVRFGLQARLARPAFYRLVESALEETDSGGVQWAVYSRGSRFALGSLT